MSEFRTLTATWYLIIGRRHLCGAKKEITVIQRYKKVKARQRPPEGRSVPHSYLGTRLRNPREGASFRSGHCWEQNGQEWGWERKESLVRRYSYGLNHLREDWGALSSGQGLHDERHLPTECLYQARCSTFMKTNIHTCKQPHVTMTTLLKTSSKVQKIETCSLDDSLTLHRATQAAGRGAGVHITHFEYSCWVLRPRDFFPLDCCSDVNAPFKKAINIYRMIQLYSFI